MSVDLRLMRYAVALAEEGGFQDAAARLHIAQPALSRQIRDLERALGVQLFRRRPTRVTAPGRAFVEEARRILADVERAVERTRLLARGEIHTVRIGYTVTAAFEALPRLLDRIAGDHPEIEVQTVRRWDGELVTELGDGHVEVALGHHLTRRPGLAAAVLRREPLAAVVSAQHPLAQRPAIGLHDLRGEVLRFLPRRLAAPYFDLVVRALHSTGEEFEVWESAEPRLGSFAVDDLGGFTVVPASVGVRLPRSVTCIPLTDPLPAVKLVVAWRSDAVSPAAELVLQTARTLAAIPRP